MLRYDRKRQTELQMIWKLINLEIQIEMGACQKTIWNLIPNFGIYLEGHPFQKVEIFGKFQIWEDEF